MNVAEPVTASGPPSGVLLHLLVVGGTVAEWADLDVAEWERRVAMLADVAARHGAQWVTVRPYGTDPDADVEFGRRVIELGPSVVILDPHADGRARFATAMGDLAVGEAVNEAAVAAVLYEPADAEPDLVLVLGPPTALPPSLVWELAYAELVFTDVSWHDLDADDVEDAIEEFSVRRRRFGGLDHE